MFAGEVFDGEFHPHGAACGVGHGADEGDGAGDALAAVEEERDGVASLEAEGAADGLGAERDRPDMQTKTTNLVSGLRLQMRSVRW